jgi:hypothetical protein
VATVAILLAEQRERSHATLLVLEDDRRRLDAFHRDDLPRDPAFEQHRPGTEGENYALCQNFFPVHHNATERDGVRLIPCWV